MLRVWLSRRWRNGCSAGKGEFAVLERLLDTARGGHGAVLVVHGDPGVGKTALLEYAVEVGEDFRVVRTAGAERETELDYAALEQLCSPILKSIDSLPDPQRHALGVAFGLSSGQAPSPFLVGLAVHSLFSEAAEQQPLLCVVDDGQWLDGASARTLAFVARRLLAERIALVFATREVGSGFTQFPELRVGPLGRRMAGYCWSPSCGSAGCLRARPDHCRDRRKSAGAP